MQLRRLDPLANAGPYQRLMSNPVKSMSLSEAQYERVKASRPQLVVTDGEAAVIGLPLGDFLEVHYAFPDIEMFVERFPAMFEEVVGASSKDEAPRGLIITFRDRPNRMTADTVFWSVALEQVEEWVEMSLVSVPEQPEPSASLGEGFEVVEGDDAAVVAVEAATLGLPPLTAASVASLRQNAKLLRTVRPAGGGGAVGLLALRTEPGGWGVIDCALLDGSASTLRKPLIEWAVAWLRNNGGRRVRTRVMVNDTPSLTVLRELGFTPGEAGFYLTRSVDKDEVAAKLSERKAHGTMIKFGDWR